MPRCAVHLLKAARYALCAGLLMLAGFPAHATLITFSEFPYTPEPEDDLYYSSDPIGDDYAALGVHIDDGYRFGATPGAPAEGMIGGHEPRITFTGTLPTFVSLNFSSCFAGFAASVSAWTPHGLAGTFSTGGWDISPPDGEWIETPYVPNSVASFHSPDGISQLAFYQVYGTRVTVLVDNLYFGAVPSVPEPSSLALFVAGLGVVGVARRRWHGRCEPVMSAA